MRDLSTFSPQAVVRPGAFRVTDFADGSLPDAICLAANGRYLAKANANPAIACVITTPDLAPQADPRLGVLAAANPGEVFYRLHNDLVAQGGLRPQTPPPGIDPSARIHPTAVVEPGAVIGPEVEIEAMAFVGSTCVLEAGVAVGVGARLGVEGHFFKRFDSGLLRLRHAGGVRLRRGAQVLSNAVVQRALFADFTEVGEETVLGPAVHLAHGVRVGDRTTLTGSVQVAGYSRIGSDVWVGPGAVIGNLLTVGDGARIEIGSVVVRAVAAGERISGAFARPHADNLRDFVGGLRGRPAKRDR